LRAQDAAAGRQAACPECGAAMTIPQPGSGAAPPAPGPAPSRATPEEPSGFGTIPPPAGAQSPFGAAGPAAENPYASPSQYASQPQPQCAPARRTDGKAVASLVLGIASLILWCCPLVGLAAAVTGLALGIAAWNSESRGFAITGVVLCSIGLLLSLANAAFGAFLAVSGHHPMFR
jgi:hypothetical protein